MKLFINAGICKQRGIVKLERLNGRRLKLQIPNYLEMEGCHENINFIVPCDNEKDLKKDVLLQSVSLKYVSKNTFEFKEKPSSEDKHIYAIIRNADAVLDDVFIPANMRNAVQVIKRIRFVDFEVDNGEFLSNVYFIKVRLNKRESLPIYLTCTEPNGLYKHYVFYRAVRDGKYHVSEKMKTLILLNDLNRADYISLAELCSK